MEEAKKSRMQEPNVLEEVGLGALAGELDTVENWPQRLSLGEQQRLAFARIHLLRPALIFMDEPTSALDESTEAHLYRLLRAASWRPTVISVSHRSTLRIFHDHILDIAAFSPPREQPLSVPGFFLDSQPACVWRGRDALPRVRRRASIEREKAQKKAA